MHLPSLYQIGETVVVPRSEVTEDGCAPVEYQEELASVIGVHFRAVLVGDETGVLVRSSRTFYDISFASDRDDIQSLAEEFLMPGPTQGVPH